VNDVLVLCYHAVSERWEASIAVPPERLRAQVARLLRGGYRPTTFTQAVLDPPAGRTLAVTFDDAYRSVLELARPVLDELGVVASIYVPTDFAGQATPMAWPGIDEWLGGPHEHELLPLGWDELGVLADAGWEVGSHTRSHPHLTTLTDDDALAAELAESRAAVTRALGRPCRSIAYPYGDMDRRVVEMARRAGYEAGGAIGSTRPPSRLDWPRVGVYQRDDARRFALKASPLVRRLRRRGPSLDRAA
jgi:peptidoglycan/xylan/chitin deacetylase (PgdA/CDA1 family)